MKIRKQTMDWFDEILKLNPGECIHIPVADKKEQKRLENELKVLRDRYTIVDEHFASQLSFGGTFHDKLRWEKVIRSIVPSNVGIKVHTNGTKEKIKLP